MTNYSSVKFTRPVFRLSQHSIRKIFAPAKRSYISRDLTLIYFLDIQQVSKLHCLLTPHIFIFTIFNPATGFICLLTSLDRLFSVIFPIKYMKLRGVWGYAVPVVSILCSMPTFIWILITDIMQSEDLTVIEIFRLCIFFFSKLERATYKTVQIKVSMMHCV